MNCRDVQALLDDVVDGSLPERERRAVTRHLEGCMECRTSEARLRALLARVRALPRSIPPAHDQWSGIVARIVAGRTVEEDHFGRGRRWVPLAGVAAAAALLIAVVSLVAAVLVGGHRGSRVAVAPERAPSATSVVPASVELARAQATYEAARRQLLAAFAVRSRSFSTQTRQVVEENLRIIDEAMGEIQAALARAPGDPDLPGLLAAAHEQEIDLLQRAATLPARS